MASKFDIVVGFSVNPELAWTGVPELVPGQKSPAEAHFHISGTSYDVASVMKKCDIRAGLIGAVGIDDPVNAVVRAALEREGISHLLLEARKKTPWASVLPETDQRFSFKLPIIKVDEELVRQTVVDTGSKFQIVTGLLPDADEIKLAKVILTENGGTRVINPREALMADRDLFREVAKSADWLFVNRMEAAEFLRRKPEHLMLEDLRDFFKLGLKLVVVTLDEEGAMIVADDGLSLKAAPYRHGKKADATGAGDCFLGFFAASILKGSGREEAFYRAMVAAGIKVTRLGSANVPSWREVLEAEANYKV